MGSFQVIYDVINHNNTAAPNELRAFKAYKAHDLDDDDTREARKLFPLILGKNTAGTAEMVQCYQYEGYSKQPVDENHVSKKNYRCFIVSDLETTDDDDPGTVQSIAFNRTDFTIEKLKYKEVKRQVCVDEDNVEIYYGH